MEHSTQVSGLDWYLHEFQPAYLCLTQLGHLAAADESTTLPIGRPFTPFSCINTCSFS